MTSLKRFGILRFVCGALSFILVCLIAARPAQAQTYTILYALSNKPSGGGGSSPLLLNAQGDIFGTTHGGVLFKLSNSGQETNLATVGTAPMGQIARDSAGNFYGTTNVGGSSGSGSIFEVFKAGGGTTLFSFHNFVGQLPVGGVTVDSAGMIFGTTSVGGGTSTCSDCGVVFEFSSAGVYSVLHRFTGGQDGKRPQSSLLWDSLGNLYGTTAQGGGSAVCADGCGTLFRMSPTGAEKTLYRFGGAPDGAGPSGGLIRDHAGNFYGTTAGGGTSTSCTGGCGTLFKIDPAGNETVLYSFQGGTDGVGPTGPLALDDEGNLYGVTAAGGNASCFCGTAFKLDPSGVETILHVFTGYPTDGTEPIGGLIRDSAGNLYGATVQGGNGSSNSGIVFKITP
jgi:uncharacterized repeat protein (TIGR03803 family)